MEENTYLSSDEVFFLRSNYSILYVPPARPSVLVADYEHHTEGRGGWTLTLLAHLDSPDRGVRFTEGSFHGGGNFEI